GAPQRRARDRPHEGRRARPPPTARADRQIPSRLALTRIGAGLSVESRPMGALQDAERLLQQAHCGIRRLVPEDAYLADAHTHLGLDEDGMTLDLETSLGLMHEWNVKPALV